MENTYTKIQELLHQKADYQARLNLIPYEGTPEIKEREGQKYLYVRKRVGSRLTSTYVDVYSDGLYQLLLRNTREARELRKQIRRVEKELAALGYEVTAATAVDLFPGTANIESAVRLERKKTDDDVRLSVHTEI